MRRTERAAYRTKFYSNLSSPTRFDEEPFISDGFLDKKAEPLTIKGSAINSLFRFFFCHEVKFINNS